MSPPSKPRGAAPKEEFSDQRLRVSWDHLGAAMGSKPQSPSCGRHGTGWLGGQRKPQPDPGPWGCPACSNPHGEEAAGAVSPSICQPHPGHPPDTAGKKCLPRLDLSRGAHLRAFPPQALGGCLQRTRSGGRGGCGPGFGDPPCSPEGRGRHRVTRRRPLEASAPQAAGDVGKEQVGPGTSGTSGPRWPSVCRMRLPGRRHRRGAHRERHVSRRPRSGRASGPRGPRCQRAGGWHGVSCPTQKHGPHYPRPRPAEAPPPGNRLRRARLFPSFRPVPRFPEAGRPRGLGSANPGGPAPGGADPAPFSEGRGLGGPGTPPRAAVGGPAGPTPNQGVQGPAEASRAPRGPRAPHRTWRHRLIAQEAPPSGGAAPLEGPELGGRCTGPPTPTRRLRF